MKFPRLLAAFLLISSFAPAAEWPQFLGPQRNGITTDATPLVDSFPDSGPAVLWKLSLGAGFAGPVVSENVVVVFHRVKDEATVDALEATTGKKKWSFSYTTDYRDQFGFDEGPRSSPTIADGKVFIHGAEGQLHALDSATGKLLWKRDLAVDFGSEQGFFGRAGAPLIVGNVVLINPGGADAAAVGLDAATGKTKWKAGKQAAGYASPILWKTKRGDCAVFWLREGLLGVSPADGKVWFDVPHRSKMEASVNAATPVVISNEQLFTSACYKVGATLWKLTADSIQPVWSKENVLDCHYATPLFFGSVLYGMHGRQEMGMELRCIDSATGKVKWNAGRMAAGECIAADGKLILITEKGELILIKQTPDKFTELDRAQILGATHRSPPALANGIFYARDKDKLVAVKLGK